MNNDNPSRVTVALLGPVSASHDYPCGLDASGAVLDVIRHPWMSPDFYRRPVGVAYYSPDPEEEHTVTMALCELYGVPHRVWDEFDMDSDSPEYDQASGPHFFIPIVGPEK